MVEHGFWSRIVHRMALGWTPVAETAFDLEWQLFGKSVCAGVDLQPGGTGDQPVFIAGLARSGSTLLLQLLHGSDDFCSLTYRDMPFVLSPNLGSRLRGNPPASAEQERAHRDGWLVNEDSPEALEEVFWRVIGHEHYIHSQYLSTIEENSHNIAEFRRYIATIRYHYRVSGEAVPRYLSKNNNNLLRLATIRAAFPQAPIMIPFRHPVAQARSLLHQHRHFCALHRDDAFGLQYMRWLVHHEFGLDHRPPLTAMDDIRGHDPATLDYWVALWIGVYAAARREAREKHLQVVFVCHEWIRQNSEAALASIGDLVNVSAHSLKDLPVHPPATMDADTLALIDADLSGAAITLYDELCLEALS